MDSTLIQEACKKLVPSINPSSFRWEVLKDLWSQRSFNSIKFTFNLDSWYIQESIEGIETYCMSRSCISLDRSTHCDKFGLLGLSLLNLQDSTCIITEGVSDYFSTKLCFPNRNVLGVTNLGGSENAKKIIVSLFDEVEIIADKDRAGLNNAVFKWKTLFVSNGIKSSIYIPESSFKDITEEVIFNIKLNYASNNHV